MYNGVSAKRGKIHRPHEIHCTVKRRNIFWSGSMWCGDVTESGWRHVTAIQWEEGGRGLQQKRKRLGERCRQHSSSPVNCTSDLPPGPCRKQYHLQPALYLQQRCPPVSNVTKKLSLVSSLSLLYYSCHGRLQDVCRGGKLAN